MDLTSSPRAASLDAASVMIPLCSISFHRYLAVVTGYLFFNAAGLPEGQFYTSVIANFCLFSSTSRSICDFL